MAEIISIATAVPAFCHQQKDILTFMQKAYELNEIDKRKLNYIYNNSNITTRYSVINDFNNINQSNILLPSNVAADFPNMDRRMNIYQQEALPLSINAIGKCLYGILDIGEISHIITVSCTGMSAPGLDLQIVEAMNLAPDIFRTSINFMGCYGAVHALKMAKMICDSTINANVMIICVELCTIHFQKEFTPDNVASSLLFGDGAAAVLVSNHLQSKNSLSLNSFYSYVDFDGKDDMSWMLSSKGFLMTLSSYVPQIIKSDITALVKNALYQNNLTVKDITHWCVHPGGKKILEVIQKQMRLDDDSMRYSKNILSKYGNMSSPTILFVLKEMMDTISKNATIFGVSFGPGLTMETFIATT